MATAISKPPSAPRMKRPPAPSVQTGANGPKQAGAAQSPKTPSKRPPSAPTPTTASGFTGANQANNRGPVRRGSQRPGESANKQTRPVKTGETGAPMQRAPEPFVRTAEYILNKYAKQAPSLVVHLHPTHFRFDQQDGSWSYQSQMKVVLEYIKQQTIPHDMIDELLRSNIKFYEGCLIVQVRDHRHAAATKERVSKDDQKENNQPFSMHKHSKFLLPSPYVPFPLPKQISPERTDSTTDAAQTGSTAENAQKVAEKETESRPDNTEERVFTTVLFPGSANLNTELLDFAAWADHVTNQRSKRAASSQKGANATSNPGSAPPAKRQKFLSDVTKLQEVEAKIISALAPPLYLDPVDNMEEAQLLLKRLRDPRFDEEPPAPKSRKRTIAELAADEALAAEEQRFMLIMDERLQSSASGATAADTEAGGATFEPRFERFKAIEEIRRLQQERQQERQREEADAKLHAQAEKERQLREHQAQDLERQKAVTQARQQQQQQQQAAQARAQQAAQQNMHPNQHPHGHLSAPKSSATNAPQAFTSAPTHQGSPAIRNMTPHNASSPVAGHAMTHSQSGQGGIPMAVNHSRQGSGSPPRPGSAMQHGHPMQPPSRNGTPNLPVNTPRMQQAATPQMHNVTAGTPRMSQSSPSMAVSAVTPAPIQAVIGTPNMNGGRPMNPQQLAAMQQHQRRQLMQQQLHQQQQQALARSQGSPNPMQMSPVPNGAMHPQQQQHLTPQQQQQILARQQAQAQAQMRAANQNQQMQMGGPQMQNGQMNVMGMPGQVQQQQQQFNPQMQQVGGQISTPQQQMLAHANKQAVHIFGQMKSQAVSKGVNLTPEIEKNLQMQAMARAKEMTKQGWIKRQQQIQQQRLQQQHQLAAQQQQQQHMMMGNMNHGNMG